MRTVRISPTDLADQAGPEASFDSRITFSDLLDTLGELVVLLAGPASDEPGTERQPQNYIDRLEGLAQELVQLGLIVRLMAPAGRVPSLHVVNPAAARLAEDIYVGRSQDGLWWFWWPWAERIAPGEEMAAAAALIARVLGARD
jgi:hypothetical protein